MKFAHLVLALPLAVALLGTAVPARAQQAANVSVSIKNHRFQPAQVQAPANVPIMLRVKNLDATPMEFESVSLRVEKVVTGNGEGIIRLRPLAPGATIFLTTSTSRPTACWSFAR